MNLLRFTPFVQVESPHSGVNLVMTLLLLPEAVRFIVQEPQPLGSAQAQESQCEGSTTFSFRVQQYVFFFLPSLPSPSKI